MIPVNCIWTDPDGFIEKVKNLRERSGASMNWEYKKSELDLKTIFFPEPSAGGAHLGRFAVWAPANNAPGCVMVPNIQDGMIQLLRHLNRHFQLRYISTIIAEDHRQYGFCGFEHANSHGEIRVIYVIKDPRWKFYERGSPLPFEDVARYNLPKKSDRLNPEIVMDYLNHLGWNLREDGFWRSNERAWFSKQKSFGNRSGSENAADAPPTNGKF